MCPAEDTHLLLRAAASSSFLLQLHEHTAASTQADQGRQAERQAGGSGRQAGTHAGKTRTHMAGEKEERFLWQPVWLRREQGTRHYTRTQIAIAQPQHALGKAHGTARHGMTCIAEHIARHRMHAAKCTARHGPRCKECTARHRAHMAQDALRIVHGTRHVLQRAHRMPCSAQSALHRTACTKQSTWHCTAPPHRTHGTALHAPHGPHRTTERVARQACLHACSQKEKEEREAREAQEYYEEARSHAHAQARTRAHKHARTHEQMDWSTWRPCLLSWLYTCPCPRSLLILCQHVCTQMAAKYKAKRETASERKSIGVTHARTYALSHARSAAPLSRHSRG